MFDRILIPVDCAAETGEFTRVLKKLNPQNIVLFNAVDDKQLSLYREIYTVLTSFPLEDRKFEHTELYKKHFKKLQALRLKLNSLGFPHVEIVIKRGTPHKKICEYALHHRIDLIILPSKGERVNVFKEIFLLGGTATRVLRSTRIPVLIIR